ncbi:DUF397 domain-containing protein [Spirillospora sp. NPDC047279]|uniref:DUF397 domain-containing protein n=1 Tax=Spirillospora sp. NPDC047279 TaxID=3155478 RepID=UPI0033F973DD
MNKVRTELAKAIWHKSSHSGSGDQCVEVASLSGHRRAVRDSKDPGGPALVLSAAEWATLVRAIR